MITTGGWLFIADCSQVVRPTKPNSKNGMVITCSLTGHKSLIECGSLEIDICRPVGQRNQGTAHWKLYGYLEMGSLLNGNLEIVFGVAEIKNICLTPIRRYLFKKGKDVGIVGTVANSRRLDLIFTGQGRSKTWQRKTEMLPTYRAFSCANSFNFWTTKFRWAPVIKQGHIQQAKGASSNVSDCQGSKKTWSWHGNRTHKTLEYLGRTVCFQRAIENNKTRN